MKVANFETFSGKIFEAGPTGASQNTPTKSGISYKDNMGYKAVNSNKETASNMVIFAMEGVGAIVSMANLLSGYFNSINMAKKSINIDMAGKMDPDAFISKRNEKGEVSVDKDQAYQMIEKYFNSMKEAADKIYATGEKNAGGSGTSDNAISAYNDELSKLVDDAKKRTNKENGQGVEQITRSIESPRLDVKNQIDKTHGYDQIFADEKGKLDAALRLELDKSNVVTYNMKMKAADYYKAAVYAFAQGGLIELRGMEEELQSEEGKSYFVDAVKKMSAIGYDIYSNDGKIK